MALNYAINAKLRLEGGGRGFERSMSRMSDRVRSFADRLRGTRSVLGGLTRSLVSLGAGYVGFHAISAGIRGAIGGMLEFNRTVESTRIGMQTILSAVDGISFEAAGETADRVFRQLQDDAITSIATGQDLAQIFTGIVGPIRAAGGSLEDVRDITLQTATAAAAAGVDFAQAQRDINRMVQGTAGMDTRLFAVLRSMGRITQSTEEWNREMTAAERITAIQEALSAFEPGGAAFGQSLQGLIATFKGLMQAFGTAFSGPVFDRMKSTLSTINNLLITNRDSIVAYLTRAGERAAEAFRSAVDAASKAASWIIARWDTISARIVEFGQQLKEHGPQLAKMAAAMGVFSGAMKTLGPVLSVVSSLMAMFEGGGMLAGVVGAGAAGEAAAGAGAAGEAAATGAGAAGEAAATGAGAAAAGPLAIALAALAGVVIIVQEHWERFVGAFESLLPVFEDMWADVVTIALSLWEVLRPILKLLGAAILVQVVPMFLLMIGVLRVVLAVLAVVAKAIAWVANVIEEYLIDPIILVGTELMRLVAAFMGAAMSFERMATISAAPAPSDPSVDRLLDEIGAVDENTRTGRTGFGIGGMETVETPDARPQSVNNFHRGSVTVRQEFRQADPDRVMVRMINSIDAQAERRVSSGFVPALTR